MEVVKKDNVGESTTEVAATPKMRNIDDLPMEKFPRINSIKNGIKDMLLNERKKLAENIEGLSAYDVNERKITALETDIKLAKYWTQIIQKEKEIEDYFNRVVIPYIDEIDSKWDELMEKARVRALTDDVLSKTLKENSPSKELCLENWEHKYNHYAALKQYLQPKK